MAIKPSAHPAGAYAEQRYQRGLRSWRAKTRPLLTAFCAPFILAGIAILILDGHRVSWFAGVLTGIFIGI